MRRSAIVGIAHTHCWEYIDDAGVQRGPFTNSEMKDWWEKLMLSKNLHIRPCDSRVSANIKRGSRQVAFHILKDWFKDASTVFATEFSPRAVNASASLRERKNAKRKSTRRTSGFEWRLT